MENYSVIFICAGLLLALFICVKLVGGKSLDRITARTVGHGQHGTARWANRREIRKYYTLVPYDVEAWRRGEHSPEYPGFVLGTYHHGRKLTAWVDASDSHAMMIASPGGGKTAYAEYSFDGADVKMESASHIPTVVTFDTSADGSDSSTYDVIEYWIPRNGSYYAKDIREKFPMLLWGKAFDASGASLQKEKCLQAARDYYGVGDPSNIMSKSSAAKWFDCLHGDEMVWDGRREIDLDEFPDVTFHWSSEKLEAVTEKETITLYTGMPIWSVYFCDLNGDGKPEVCSSISFGSGIIDNRIIVADYANKAVYELSDRGHYD